ncbi:septum site-determining protein Ssd [Nocardiopsis sp. FIRDI 009]|uniref:septum site-determining protein Ssd n=1 Tax=Nocardiopsis sp. FIRDI 009 TaxID=714197 RepID=UPI000E26BC7B|nr:septum site-determining protein Ssd [Nocardiopsis sp. FIRDI 009]
MDTRFRPLLATDDPVLLDDLLRLAAAASTEVTVARSAVQALRSWSRSPLVVVGADLLPALIAADAPAHPRAVVVTRNHAAGGGSPTGTADRRPGRPRAAVAAPWNGGPTTGGRPFPRLPGDESELVDLLAGAAARGDPPAPTVAVMGGRGGAGATLTAVALALAGGRSGRDTALLDADPFGCGPDVYLGCDLAAPVDPGHRTGWNDLLHRDGRVRWHDLRPGLPGALGVSVLTWDRRPAASGDGAPGSDALPADTARAALDSAREGTGLVVVDLPRSFDAATTEFLNRADRVHVVVPADVPSVVAASRVAPRLRTEAPGVSAVVIGSGGELTADVIARTLGLPLAADLPREPGLARLLSAGRAPARHRRSPLARFADRVVAELPAAEPVR